METLYGILSDFHQCSPLDAKVAVHKLKNLGANYLILNGDLIGEQNPHQMSPQYFLYFLLKAAADTNLETYVQCGSHEEFFTSTQVIEHKANIYDNIRNITKQQRIELPNHHLVFLPGSDSNSHGGEYTLGTNLPTGLYLQTEDGLLPIETKEMYQTCQEAIRRGEAAGILHYENVNDLGKLVTAPEKTILICHVPPKCDGKYAIDRAQFGVATESFELYNGRKKREVRKGSIHMLDMAKHLREQGAPIEIRDENVGNSELATIMQTLGLTKSINGHIHEAAHHAHTVSGDAVEQGKFTKSLQWNASCMDRGKVGILRVNGTQVAYQNIQL